MSPELVSNKESNLIPSEYFFWFLLSFVLFLIFFQIFNIKLFEIIIFSIILFVLAIIFKNEKYKFLILTILFALLLASLRLTFNFSLNFENLNIFINLKEKVSEIIAKIYPEPMASFAKGLVIGSTNTKFDSLLYSFFQKTSTSHLIAVSGFNITLIASFLNNFLRALTVNRKLSLVLSIFLTLFFVIFIGLPVSALRAWLMYFLIVISQLVFRPNNFKISLVFSLFLILSFTPSAIFDLSLQLSFLATFGLFYLAPILANKFHFKDNLAVVSKTLSETLGCYFMVLPLILYNFGTMSLVGILANLFAIPLIPIVTSLTFLTIIVYFVSQGLALILAGFNSVILNFILKVIEFFGSLKFSAITGFWPNISLVIAYYLLLAIFMFKDKKIYGNYQQI
ncbi:MAG TPA: ComEC/Rec2 family competence protein [Candidatus Paceibacterota bacterium]|nr:ComEC/Rec2 family competence protein [Candidatus Paceibacterota bacterium]HRS47948.1 ComEC/Rec2 family competence protein [Candidatus Paceibacterota bacterium]